MGVKNLEGPWGQCRGDLADPRPGNAFREEVASSKAKGWTGN